jgi:hypothetical protein
LIEYRLRDKSEIASVLDSFRIAMHAGADMHAHKNAPTAVTIGAKFRE